jgi:hypothetical protein
MANIDYKHGTYTIQAHETQQFTFWWGAGSKAPNEYFDVSVAPAFNHENEGMTPLVEAKREIYLDASQSTKRVVLLLTLQNNNNFAVTFVANHVRIY